MKRPKKFDELTITDDFMFCKVMENNEELCRELAECILGVKIEKIYDLGQQKVIRIMPDKRGIRMDVSFAGDDRIYNIEMENWHKKELPKRNRYYQSLIDLDMMDSGEPYYDLPDTCIIFICTFDPFGYGLPRYTVRQIIEENNEIQYNDGTAKVFVSTAGAENRGIRPELKALLDYMQGKPAADGFVKRLDAAVKKARSMETWRKEYMLLEEKYAEYLAEGREAGREEGREEGRKEGREEGREEGLKEGSSMTKLEIARKMLRRGDSCETIAELTDLPLEQVAGLREAAAKK